MTIKKTTKTKNTPNKSEVDSVAALLASNTGETFLEKLEKAYNITGFHAELKLKKLADIEALENKILEDVSTKHKKYEIAFIDHRACIAVLRLIDTQQYVHALRSTKTESWEASSDVWRDSHMAYIHAACVMHEGPVSRLAGYIYAIFNKA